LERGEESFEEVGVGEEGGEGRVGLKEVNEES